MRPISGQRRASALATTAAGSSACSATASSQETWLATTRLPGATRSAPASSRTPSISSSDLAQALRTAWRACGRSSG